MKMKKSLLFFVCIFISTSISSQTDIWYWKNNVATKVEAVDSVTFVEPIQEIAEDSEKEDRIDYGTKNASEISISFGASSIRTGSNILSPFCITNQKLGLFMLAKDIVPNNNYSDITWNDVNWANHDKQVTISNIGNLVDKWSVLVWNKSANVTMYDAAGNETTNIIDGAKSTIAFIGEQQYYPIGNYCSYSMYGYYPLQSIVTDGADKNCTVDKSKLTITIPVTGADDVLWGRASYSNDDVEGTDIPWFTPGESTGIIYNGQEITDLTAYGYSAKFFSFSPFHTVDTDVALVPTMKFKHKMAMLKFEVMANDNASNNDAAYKTTISSISVANVPSSIDMVVADLDNNANEGVVTASQTTTSLYVEGTATPMEENGKPVRVPLKDANGNESYIILPANPVNDYWFDLVLRYNNEAFATSVALHDKKFEEGKIYRVIIKVYSPTQLMFEFEDVESTEENWNNCQSKTEDDNVIHIH